jgi:hypothetical protein
MLATESLQRIQSCAESICCDKPQRFSEGAGPGSSFRQGDLYITLLDGLPAKADQVEGEAQLAPGTTKGSRHVLDSLEGVTMYKIRDANVLQGPVFSCVTERTVEHPEHGNVILPPGTYGVTYQRAYAEELRRVAD